MFAKGDAIEYLTVACSNKDDENPYKMSSSFIHPYSSSDILWDDCSGDRI